MLMLRMDKQFDTCTDMRTRTPRTHPQKCALVILHVTFSLSLSFFLSLTHTRFPYVCVCVCVCVCV